MVLARRILALPIALVLAGVALAGCATPVAGDPSSSPTAGNDGTEAEVDAAWLDDGRIIGLVTTGSSTCIPAADEAMLDDDGTLAVTLVEPEADTPCTSDLVPRVTLVEVPEGVDPAENLPITVTGDGYEASTELAGVAGLTGGGMTDYLPSAGWTETAGQFVLLTWGSSSCAPVIAEVAASGPAEVTVTFQAPPADQVCTMDMAPRAAVAVVEGLEAKTDVELVLTGSPEFADVRVPIYGEN